MKNEFLHKKIAVLFNTEEEHAFILQYFGKPKNEAWHKPGVCSFYTEVSFSRDKKVKITSAYRCTDSATIRPVIMYPNYIILTFTEFEFLIDETICPLQRLL